VSLVTTVPKEGLRILARMIARAYLADCQSDDEAKNTPGKKVSKAEGKLQARRNKTHGKANHRSQG